MHPLTSADIQPTFLAKKPILLLNTRILPVCTLIHYIIAGAAGNLPTEIWLKIIEYAKPEDAKYKAVQPTSIVPSKRGTILQCRLVNLDLTFYDRAEVKAAEQWLESPHTYEQQRESDDGIAFGAEETDKTFAILFPSTPVSSGDPAPALSVPDCLFTAVTVPDVISRLHQGRCEVCDGRRGICPGCTGGVAQRYHAEMGCGELLACPLCMGLDFMGEDKEFLQEYYWDEPPSDEKAARDARLRARWDELGYSGW
ncbi:MAG: hypothetical protein Q9211_000595 [Gyalolechia sp. 1 TL-2023]